MSNAAQPAQPGLPAATQVQHPTDDKGGSAQGHNDAIRAKLTSDLKKTTAKRAAAEAKGKGADAGKGGGGKQTPKQAKGDKGEPRPEGARPRRTVAPETDDDADAGKGGEERESKPGKGKGAGKGKGGPVDKHEAKREAARKALEQDAATEETLDAATKGDDEETEGEVDDDQSFKKQKREFAKHKRKKEAEYEARERKVAGREANVGKFEERANEELGLFKKDPLAWLKKRDIDVREVLVKFADEDGEDPKEKKLRELEDRVNKRDERDEANEKTQAVEGIKRDIQSGIYTSFEETDGGDYPNLWTHSDPERVARAGLRLVLDHWAQHREKLAPRQVLDMLEEQLIAHNTRKAHEAKRNRARSLATEDGSSEPPEQVRSVSSREPVTPEPRRSARRASEDVTRRDTGISRDAESYRGSPGSFDRESTRDRMLEMTRERLR